MSDKNKGRVTLYLMRHGQTILNKVGRTQGWCDGVLTKEGIEVAVNTGLGLSDVKFKAVYSSDLGRAIKTAQIVIKENKASVDLELKEFEGLREVYFGKYEGEFEKIKFKAILDFLNVTSFEEMAEKYDFQRAYCDSCAALDETHEAEDYNTALKILSKPEWFNSNILLNNRPTTKRIMINVGGLMFETTETVLMRDEG